MTQKPAQGPQGLQETPGLSGGHERAHSPAADPVAARPAPKSPPRSHRIALTDKERALADRITRRATAIPHGRTT